MLSKLTAIGFNLVKGMAVLILSTLTLIGLTTYVHTGTYLNTGLMIDSKIVINIISILIFSIPYMLLCLLYKLSPKFRKNYIKIYFIAMIIIFLFIISHLPLPIDDQFNIYEAINMMKHQNYSFMNFLYFRVWSNTLNQVMYQSFFLNPFIFYLYNFALYLVSFHLLNKMSENNFYLATLFLSFTQLLYFCNYFYGEITGIFVTTLLFYMFHKAFSNQMTAKHYAILFIVYFLGNIENGNIRIVTVAALCCTLFYLIQNFRNKKSLIIFSATLLLASCLAGPAVNAYFGCKTGKTLNPIVQSTWIAMGLHEKGTYNDLQLMDGSWDGTNSDFVTKSNMNFEAADRAAKADIKKSLAMYMKDPIRFSKFLRNKIAGGMTFSNYGIGISLKPGYFKHAIENKDLPLAERLIKQSNFDRFETLYWKGLMLASFILTLYFTARAKYIDHSSLFILVLIIGYFLFNLLWETHLRHSLYLMYCIILFAGLNLYKHHKIKETDSHL